MADEKQGVSRRGLLQAGAAAALGAVLMPRTSIAHEPVAGALPQEYRAVLDRVATTLRPGFESGEYRGWNDDDSDRMDTAHRRHDPDYVPPEWRLEKECARQIADPKTAMTVLVCSLHAPYGWHTYEMNHDLREQAGVVDGRYDPVDVARVFHAELCGKAGVAMARDVLEIALERKWYMPDPSERPTAADLLAERVKLDDIARLVAEAV